MHQHEAPIDMRCSLVQRMYDEAQSAAIKATSTAIFMPDDAGGAGDCAVQSSVRSSAAVAGPAGTATARIPPFLRETPYDTGVTRSVKRVYGTIESLR